MKVYEKEKKNNVLLKFAFAILLVYFLIQIINQQMTIAQKKEEYTQLSQQIEEQTVLNLELQQMSEIDDDDYIERVARDTLNYAKPDERIFVNVAGN